jgi:hypothetical protein
MAFTLTALLVQLPGDFTLEDEEYNASPLKISTAI